MKKLLTIALSMLVLAGCQHQPNKAADYPQLQFAPGTASHFNVQRVAEGFTDGGLLRVSIQAQNQSSHTKQFSYRFTWLDQQGFEVDSLTSRWEKVQVLAHEPIIINRIATSPKAVNYTVFISDKRSITQAPAKGNQP